VTFPQDPEGKVWHQLPGLADPIRE
jgi:hypothetical protein